MSIPEAEGGPLSTAPELTDFLPFVYNERDCQLLNDFYRDSSYVRVPLSNAKKLIPLLPAWSKPWVDAEIDGLHNFTVASEQFRGYVKQFRNPERVMEASFQAKPEAGVLEGFVSSVLDACAEVAPRMISVPQLPITSDSSRHKINREFARAASVWAEKHPHIGLILPVVFTNQVQLNRKTARNPKISQIVRCFEASNAKGVWAVDASMVDQDGAGTLDVRFRGLIDMHQELAARLPPDTSVVAGPYWGLNVILWARGIIKYPAVTMGNRYRYHLPGGRAQPANIRIAINPLKRLSIMKPELLSWLAEAAKKVPPTDPAFIEFAALHAKFKSLWREGNRDQICNMYRKWLDSLALAPPPGRGLKLYQQFSSSYVLGKTLSDLPEDGPTRRPERIAQQFMLLCL